MTALDFAARGLAARTSRLLRRTRAIPLPIRPNPLQQVMASPPAFTSGTAATLTGQKFQASYQQTGSYVAIDRQRFTYYRAPRVESYFAYAVARYHHIAAGDAGLRGTMAVGFFHTGQNLEFMVPGNAIGGTGGGSNFLVKVDDEYVSLTPTTPPNDGILRYYKLAFASRARRRIDIIGLTYFAGVWTDAADSIDPAPVRGPRVLVIGDSISGGSAGSFGSADNWPAHLSDLLGWDDVIPSAQGGTGYLTAGSYAYTPRQRFQMDVVPYAPDIVIFACGRNDTAQAAAAVEAEVAALLAECASSLPGAVRIVTSPLLCRGPQTWTSAFDTTRNAIAAAAAANGAYFIDVMNRPFVNDRSGVSTSLAAAVAAGASTFSVPFNTSSDVVLPVPCTVRIDSEIVYARSAVNATYTIDGTFDFAHSSGAVVTQLGDPLFTGGGTNAAPSGFGNSDEFTYSDGIHPTSAGMRALGGEIGTQILALLG